MKKLTKAETKARDVLNRLCAHAMAVRVLEDTGSALTREALIEDLMKLASEAEQALAWIKSKGV